MLTASQTSKSQLYHYFTDKDDLVRAVIAWRTERVVDTSAQRLAAVDTWDALDAFFDDMITFQEARGCQGGCPIGTLAAELADRSEDARTDLAASFAQWETALRQPLLALRSRGELDPTADIDYLATAVLAAFQGGVLLAKTMRDPQRLRVALGVARAHLHSYARQPSKAM